MKLIHNIVTALIIALGLLHTAVTFLQNDRFDIDAVWFASAGIAMILAGFLNVVLLRQRVSDRLIFALVLIANITFAVLFAVVSFILPQPQVYFGIALFGAASALSVANTPASLSGSA
ncbi:MAG: hypothetical protein ABIV21_07530 [Pyrinomonadaceae bacterium]